MENCDSSDPRPKKQKCWGGEQGKEKGKPMMAFVKKKKPKKQEIDVEEGVPRHMNVRDLGNNPGDIRMQKSSSGSSFTEGQKATGRALERNRAEQSAKLVFKRRK